MTAKKSTNPWAEDVAKLKEVLEERQRAQLEESMKRMGDMNEYIAGLEKRVFASMGIPAEFMKDCKVTSHIHDSVTVEVPKKVAAAMKPNANGDIHSLEFAAKHFLGSKAKGSVPMKNVHVDKKLLWGLLYGSNLGVSMGASVAAAQAQVNQWGRKRVFPQLQGTKSGRFSSHQPNPVQHPSFIRGRRRHEQFLKSIVVTSGLPQNRGTYKVVKVIDECQVYVEPVGTGIMCQPVLQTEVLGYAGYEPACVECQHGIHCLRGKHPNVCSHCRATVPQHVAGQHSFDGRIEAEYCRLQIAEERVSSSCPLFKYSLMVCAHCREQRPYVTRVRIPDRQNLRRARFKVVKIRRVPTPQKTFREHLLQHCKGRGDLHQRQQARHNRKAHGKTNQQQAQRRPGRRAKKRR